jgi:hypothetical protein
MSIVAIRDDSRYFLIDWPEPGMNGFLEYRAVLNEVGFCISLKELMDWGCYAYQLIGRQYERIPEVPTRLYLAHEDLLPRGHDASTILEYMLEAVEASYYAYVAMYDELFASGRRVWVVSTEDEGILLEVERG